MFAPVSLHTKEDEESKQSMTLRSTRSRSIDTGDDEDGLGSKKLVHGFTWHTSTDRTADDDSSCSSFGSFCGDNDLGVGGAPNTAGGGIGRRKAVLRPKKEVCFDRARNKVIPVESWKAESELWWDGEELMEIKGDCNVVMREHRKNTELIDSIATILAQGMTNTADPTLVKKFMSQMRRSDAARGLERDVAAPCSKLVLLHYKCVFDTQKKLREKNIMGSDKAMELLAKSCEKSSKAFGMLAVRLAQHDTREAMKAAFTFQSSRNLMVKGKKNRMQRRASSSGGAIQLKTKGNRRASLSGGGADQGGGGPPVDRRNAMAKRSGGFDRRKMLAHSVSMRSVNSKYGSLGF